MSNVNGISTRIEGAVDSCEVTFVDAERVAAARLRVPAAIETDRLAEWF